MKTLTVSEAKGGLGRHVDRALRGEGVFIRRGDRFVQIIPAVVPDPIPVYAPGALVRSDDDVALLMSMSTDDEHLPLESLER